MIKNQKSLAPPFFRKAVEGYRGEKPLSAAKAVLRQRQSERTSVSAVERLVLKDLDKPDNTELSEFVRSSEIIQN